MDAKPLVQILWHDSRDADESWIGEEDALKYGEEPCEVYSVGFLISKGSKFHTLGADWNPQDKDYGRVTKIPNGMVISLEYLEPQSS